VRQALASGHPDRPTERGDVVVHLSDHNRSGVMVLSQMDYYSSCLQHLLGKSRDAMICLRLFYEESKLTFLIFTIVIQERPALIQEPKAERDFFALDAPLCWQPPSTRASFQPASSYRPATSFWIASFIVLRNRLWPLRCPCRPMPPPPRRHLCPLLLRGSALR